MDKQVTIKDEKILAQDQYLLKKVTFELKGETQKREIYDRGNGAAILLYNREKGTVILTTQFRLPSYVNGNSTGMLIEACAGFLDGDEPEACVRRESEEETGYKVKEVKKVFEAYSSPGGLTELLYYFVAPYTDNDKVSKGGGLKDEQEDINILELPFEEAISLMNNGEIRDAKTIILLQYALINKLIGGTTEM